MKNYEKLFQPLRIRNLVLRNRLIFGPIMISAIDGNNAPTDYSVDFFAARAQGGAAVVVVGDTPVDSKYAPTNFRHFVLDDPGTLPMMTALTDGIKSYGAVPSILLNHAGAVTLPAFLKAPAPIGPCDVKRPDGVAVRAMDAELIHYTIESFARAAAFAKLAGYEMVSVCASDGWLLHQFLSPGINRRKDRYGGSLENRMRLPLEILQAVRRQVGEDTAIELRLCADDFTSNGIRLQEAKIFAAAAEPYVDLIQVVCGSNTNTTTASKLMPNIFLPHVTHKELTAAIKESVSIPVVLNGAVMTPDEAEQVIAEGWADAVSMCRAMIADPELPNKARMNAASEIRPCLRCLRCHGDMQRTREFHCTVNPYCGREHRLSYQRALPSDKRIVVIGGGPAGLTAALAAADRGCRVTLFEAAPQLGGSLNRAQLLPHREDMKRYRDYLTGTVIRHPNITVLPGIHATPELVKAQCPDGVIAAIGAQASIPEKTLEKMQIAMDERDLYRQEEPPTGNVIVIGGGESGCDAAIYLAEKGASVTLLECKPTILPLEQRLLRIAWQEELKSRGVRIQTSINCVSVNPHKVIAIDLKEQKKVEYPADAVIFAIGENPAVDRAEEFRDCALSFAEVGSCIHRPDLKRAIFDGFCAGRYL